MKTVPEVKNRYVPMMSTKTVPKIAKKIISSSFILIHQIYVPAISVIPIAAQAARKRTFFSPFLPSFISSVGSILPMRIIFIMQFHMKITANMTAVIWKLFISNANVIPFPR